jgi:hypothetical protein
MMKIEMHSIRDGIVKEPPPFASIIGNSKINSSELLSEVKIPFK